MVIKIEELRISLSKCMVILDHHYVDQIFTNELTFSNFIHTKNALSPSKFLDTSMNERTTPTFKVNFNKTN